MSNGVFHQSFRRARSVRTVALALTFGCLCASLRAQTAGTLDAGFALTSVLGDRVVTVSPQSDGNIVVGGTITQIDGVTRRTVARVHTDGTLDASFVPPLIESYNTRTDPVVTVTNPAYIPAVFTTAIQPDGKILVGGSFYFVNGQSGFGGLIRLNPDGSLDSTFSVRRFSGTVFSVVVQPNGKILVGGDFSYVDSRHRNCLARLNSDGTLDRDTNYGTFAGTVASGQAISAFPTVAVIRLQADGKVVAGGIFTSVNDTSRRGIARFNTDGSLDGSFVPDPAFDPASPKTSSASSIDQVLALVIQGDGKIVVGGSFVDPNTQTPINSLYRLDTTGSLDATFNPGGAGTFFDNPGFINPSPVVNSLLLQSDGKIILGGSFAAYNRVGEALVARLNPDGTLDTSFAIGDGPASTVFALALQTDGKLLISGTFNTVDSVARPLVARINTVANVPPAVVVTIVPSTKRAHENGSSPGVFTVTRSGGNPESDLLVRYTVAGNAVPGTDYKMLKGRVTIRGGSNTAFIKVRPIAGPVITVKEKVAVILTPTAAYGVAVKPRASVIIVSP